MTVIIHLQVIAYYPTNNCYLQKVYNHTSKKTYVIEIWEQLERKIKEIQDNIAQSTNFNQGIEQSSNQGRMK